MFRVNGVSNLEISGVGNSVILTGRQIEKYFKKLKRHSQRYFKIALYVHNIDA